MQSEGQRDIMRLSSTRISEGCVQLRFEGESRDGAPIEWIDIQVKHTADECQPLAVCRKEALQRAQSVIDAEISRLQALAGRVS
jgi:hypothetical protein